MAELERLEQRRKQLIAERDRKRALLEKLERDEREYLCVRLVFSSDSSSLLVSSIPSFFPSWSRLFLFSGGPPHLERALVRASRRWMRSCDGQRVWSGP